jgi:S-formylglutathione hydrolase FrmB
MADSQGVGRFRTIELSDPVFEDEGLRTLTLYSPALRGRGDASLFIPAQCESLTNVPMVILLHGVYGSHWAWFLKGGAHRTAQRLIAEGKMRPMVIVSPSDGLAGDGTGYIRQPDCDYERWISDDVIDCVGELFPCTGPERCVFIAGLSMGGYGALRIGAKYAGRFQGISAHSAITAIEQMSQFIHEPLRIDAVSPEDLDILHWMQLHRDSMPPLRFDCGSDDQLFAANVAFHKKLTQLDIEHHFQANDGDHSWPYWQRHIEYTFLFFENVVRVREGTEKG